MGCNPRQSWVANSTHLSMRWNTAAAHPWLDAIWRGDSPLLLQLIISSTASIANTTYNPPTTENAFMPAALHLALVSFVACLVENTVTVLITEEWFAFILEQFLQHIVVAIHARDIKGIVSLIIAHLTTHIWYACGYMSKKLPPCWRCVAREKWPPVRCQFEQTVGAVILPDTARIMSAANRLVVSRLLN